MAAFRFSICLATATVLSVLTIGCCRDKCDYLDGFAPQPLGTISDSIWQTQEFNAEASDFVIHEHEFMGNTPRLNKAGEVHVKQIAARAADLPFPIIVEQSSMSPPAGDPEGIPVHGNDELDARRRQMIVSVLSSNGVSDAHKRVVIAPALTPGFDGFEAERAYQNGFSMRGFGGGGGFGGGRGGGFGGGGFGF
ncbi:MAG: hypothetical protein IID46_02060 [Planctomycetes bacterium]|nr:hypothetical protein [Planctomycetota bacterium]